MRVRLVGVFVCAAILLMGRVAAGEAPDKASSARTHDAQALAEKVDQHIARQLAEAKVKPAADAADAEFLRRVYLDLAGRIPSVAEARAFLGDARPDRRSRLIEHLLKSSRYVTHFTNVWRAVLIPEAGNNFLVRIQQGGFEGWLKQQLTRNAGFDQMARALLTAPIGGQGGGIAALANLANGEPGPLAFYSAKEFRPENLAAGTARVFLGINAECAQCHNHPFADWKREQFWGLAAFFSGVKSQTVMDFLLPGGEDPNQRTLTMPGTEKVIPAKFLDGTEPTWKPATGARATLAEWVTASTNPYFARAAVNRVWAYLFGTGLVEPVDEMVGGASEPSHPELLDLLAREFTAHGFDLKFLLQALTSTRTYQRTSAAPATTLEGQTLFAAMPLRGLTPEQLFDSVALATGYRDAGNAVNDVISSITGGNRSARSIFQTRFANQTERPVEAQTSILQALTMMNGKVAADATSLERSETLAAVVDAPFATTTERVTTLYLATLSRRPTAQELDRAVRFVQSAVNHGVTNREEKAFRTASGQALADVFWVLLNSSEFALNH